MEVRFNQYRGIPGDIELAGATLTVNPEELRTIYAALQEYKQNLLGTVAKSKEEHGTFVRTAGTLVEDEAFCYTEAGKVAKLQYDLVEDHGDSTVRRMVQELVL